MKLCQLASGQSFSVTCYAETGFKDQMGGGQPLSSTLSSFLPAFRDLMYKGNYCTVIGYETRVSM